MPNTYWQQASNNSGKTITFETKDDFSKSQHAENIWSEKLT
jgi:hypothetical protein